MITPVSILTIKQICDRQNDLIVSAEDINEISEKAKIDAIKNFSGTVSAVIRGYGATYGELLTPSQCASFIEEVAKHIESGDTNETH